MEVIGHKEVIAELLGLKNETFRRVVEAVEKTAVRMSARAKAGHEHGSDPHSRGRFERQTGNLVASISPGGAGGQPMQWEKFTEDEVVGLFGVDSTAPAAPMEYAEYVEEGYPFIWPAAASQIENFKKEIAAAANPDRKK